MKRFYKDVTVAPEGEGWRVLLDGRGIRTGGGKPQVVPTRALAEAMGAEWSGQGEEIDTSAFRMRDLADFALDAVAPAMHDAIADILPYAETDTLCYRADPEEALYRRQIAVWEPLLTEAEARHEVRFTRISGIVHRPQPAETLARLRDVLERQDPFSLAALRMMASLAASLAIALAALEPDADIATLWDAANLEEDWQAQLWGQDAEAAESRQTRLEAFALAMRFAALAREVQGAA